MPGRRKLRLPGSPSTDHVYASDGILRRAHSMRIRKGAVFAGFVRLSAACKRAVPSGPVHRVFCSFDPLSGGFSGTLNKFFVFVLIPH